jgi:integrase
MNSQGVVVPIDRVQADPQLEHRKAKPSPTRGIFEKQRGTGIWWIRFTDASGRYRRERVGAFGLAQKLLDKRRGEAVTGKKLPEILRRKVASFSDLVADAIAYVERTYARPADDVARLKLIRTWFESRGAEDVKTSEIELALRKAAMDNDWSPSTTNHYHNLMSLMYRLAIKAEKVGESPVHRKLRKVKEGDGRVRFLTPQEEKKLREAIRSNPTWAPHEPELDFALSTGLRRGSMYQNLLWENIDLGGRTATIPKTKNGTKLVLPLNDDAVRALELFRSRGDGVGRVVRNIAGKTLAYNSDWFVPAVRKAGIQDFRWHDCRHTFASRLVQNGVALHSVAELLGHSKKTGLAMTMRYAHLSISNLHEAVSRISNSTRLAPGAVPTETADISSV